MAVGIIARGPVYGSKPLAGPQDIQLEFVCSRAPRQGPPPATFADESSTHGFARGFIRTYAFGDDELDYDNEIAGDEYKEDNESEDDFETDVPVECPDKNT